jgi:hypothetical protein
MKPTVYIETTIVSYLTARPSRDLIRAAQQEITREWWRYQSEQVELFTSQLVIVEASAGDPQAAAERIEMLRPLLVLAMTEPAVRLGIALIAAAALPAVAVRDAQHVAIAATNGIEFMLTWNCRHLANAFLRDRIEDVCEKSGFRAPKICTPEELPGVQP